jgi:copper chaperone
MQTTTYSVPGMTCAHCRVAITEEVRRVHGVRFVDVDLNAKSVAVDGVGFTDAAVRAAIDDAGYDVAA